MSTIKQQITEAFQIAVKEVTGIDTDVIVSSPTDSSKGDYTSTVAMVLFSKNHESGIKNQGIKTPYELAEKIKDQFIIHNSRFLILDRIEAVKPGFINFWLSESALFDHLSSDATLGDAYKGKKVMVEFTDPNPFKEFHIGHLYSNTVGESLSRLFESQGAEVWRVTYQGDVGLHVAKAIWGLLNKYQMSNIKSQINTNKDDESNLKLEIKKWLEEIEKNPLEKRIKLLGEAYAMGAKAYEGSETAKEEINALNKKVYEKDPEILEIYEKGRQWSLNYFESIYKRLGSKFVKNYFESVAGPIGLVLVREHIGKVFVESQGAVIFPGEQYGLHSRVFINSLGLPTYEAKDMGLPPTKYKDFPYDKSIIITGEEQSGYFKVVLKALSLISPELEAKTKHIAHGMVRLPGGKMSSRTGNVITGQWLLDEAKKKISENFKDMGEKTLEMVAVGAVKYSLLKFSIGSDVSFSFDESVSLEGNSGPYIQYSYARTRSVLKKGESGKGKEVLNASPLTLHPEEVLLLRTLYRFPEIVEEAAKMYAPNTVCTYLFQLAQLFNNFYQKHKIIQVDKVDEVNSAEQKVEVQAFRLVLTEAVGNTLKSGLDLLGIKAPEKM